MIIPKNKIDKKWYVWIWVSLIFASLIRNAYSIYIGYTEQSFVNAGQITLNVLMDIFFSGILPAFICYLCGIILYGMLWRRGIVIMSRNDFAYWGMIFTAAARIVIGMFEVFSILEPSVYPYTMSFFEEVFLSLSLYLMGLVFFKQFYNLNDRKIYEAFSVVSPVYLFFQGLNTVLPAGLILVLKGNPMLAEQLSETMEVYMGVTLTGVDVHLFVASVAAIALFIALICINIGLSFLLKKKADACPAELPDDYDDFNPFEGFDNENKNAEKEDKVFDEFDI